MLKVEVASNAAATTRTDVTSAVRIDKLQAGGVAAYAEVGTGTGFDLDDDAADVSLPARRRIWVTETATSPDTVLHRGRLTDRAASRGLKRVEPQKKFDVSTDDSNAELRGIPIDDWNRPAETDVARVNAVLTTFLDGSPRASTVISDAFVSPSNTVMMDAKRYEAADPAQVIAECAKAAGKQAFVTVDDELFYDLDTSLDYAAGLSVTDDAANDETGLPTFPPIWDAGSAGSYEGNELFTGITVRGRTTSAVANDAAAEAAHDYWRKVVYESDASSSEASSIAASLLANQKQEEFRASFSLLIRDDQVDLVKYGHALSFRAAAAGKLTPVTLRVVSLYWEPVGWLDGHRMYLAHIEAGVPQKTRRRVPKGRPRDTPLPPFVPEPDPGCSTEIVPTEVAVLTYANGSNLPFGVTLGYVAGVGPTWSSGAVGANREHAPAPAFAYYYRERRSIHTFELPEGAVAVRIRGRFEGSSPTSLTGVTPPDVEDGEFYGPVVGRIYTTSWDEDTADPTSLGGWTPNGNEIVSETWSVPLNAANGPEWSDAFDVTIPVSGDKLQLHVTCMTPVGGSLWTHFSGHFIHTWLDDYAWIDGDGVPPMGQVGDWDGAWSQFGLVGPDTAGLPIVEALCGSVPLEGQRVLETVGTGDGSTTGFATTFPFRAAHLVYLNNLPEFGFDATPPTGIELDDPAFDGEVVRVDYEAAGS